MLPLHLLQAANGRPMQVELKNGETYNGHLVDSDNFMNISLKEVIQTSADGDRFWRLEECYIKGSTIKYLRIPDEVIDVVQQDMIKKRQAAAKNKNQNNQGGGRGGYNNRGGNRGSRGRGNYGNRGGRGH
ncbi:Sm-like ribonucleo protein [Conidiobolus coronatus NRRL 28638]|uniref:LSM complex subunit LSM4 n=1 Tax=Conidiobolus coronatus (strain ATCC 28846 / CBS 209.66 / NRRL 28638) TaxID=796925 RepID=A0A137NRJ3_CONC2|nr:Sm-like ribonucleo protein [Conidiobolus coronatus NRRL 28638]|eukprot:KXN65342.1 Sm-like ribonucleo protein [Conidiobolus coronatus NRRL 28638]